jgi:phage gp45-like
MNNIIKGFILSLSQDKKRCEVKTIQGEILKDVLLLFPYGFYSAIDITSNTEILLFYANGSKTLKFGIPYNVINSPNNLIDGDIQIVQNIGKNKITLKKNGDIEIEGSNIKIGGAGSNALNESADMSINIPSGSSAGVYSVSINNAGQNKVKI